MSLDLVFASKGSAGVLAELAKLKQGAKLANDELKKDNQALLSLSRDVQRSYTQTLTPIEKLRQQAGRLQEALKNTKLPDLDKQKAAQALERVNAKIKDIEGNTGKASNKLSEAFGSGKAALLGAFATSAGAVAASIGLVIKTLIDEMRAAQELADKASATQLSVAASRNVVIRNLPGADDATIRQVLGENAGLAAATGVSETAINQARASALSASGGNIEASRRATEIAARFLSDRPSEIGDFAGSLLDLSKVTGSTDARVNLGLLSTVGGLSRITGQREQATSIAPALIGAREFGFSTSESAALFSAITTASGDLTGRQSGTATIQLAKQLEAFNPEQLAGMTTGQKLAALQSNRALADQFMADASFEAKSFGPIRSLLTNPQSYAARQYRSNLTALPGTQGLRAKGQRSLDAFSVNTLESVAAVDRAISSTLEQLELDAPATASTEQIRRIQQILQLSGSSATGARLRTSLQRYANGDSTIALDELASLVSPVIADLRDGSTRSEFVSGGTFGGVTITKKVPATEGELKNAELLEQLLQELKRNTTATEQSGGLTANGT